MWWLSGRCHTTQYEVEKLKPPYDLGLEIFRSQAAPLRDTSAGREGRRLGCILKGIVGGLRGNKAAGIKAPRYPATGGLDHAWLSFSFERFEAPESASEHLHENIPPFPSHPSPITYCPHRCRLIPLQLLLIAHLSRHLFSFPSFYFSVPILILLYEVDYVVVSISLPSCRNCYPLNSLSCFRYFAFSLLCLIQRFC